MGLSIEEVEMKKRRYAGNILKSKNPQQVMIGRVERRRREEIKRQREAARIAINNVTKTLDFDNNLDVMKDFEKLLDCTRASELQYEVMRGREEIKRQREAARKAINNVTKTLDFDNFDDAMKEFESPLVEQQDFSYLVWP